MRRYAGLSGWLVAGVVLLAGAGDRAEVRCRRLAIEDESGRDRITLTMVGGNPGIDLYDSQGEARLSAVLMAGGQPAITLNARGEKSRVVIGVNDKGMPMLYTRDEQGGRHHFGSR